MIYNMTKVVGFRENMVESIITVIFCHPDQGVGVPFGAANY